MLCLTSLQSWPLSWSTKPWKLRELVCVCVLINSVWVGNLLDFADDDDKSSLLFCCCFHALYWTQYSPYLTLVLNPGLHFLIADARSKVKDPLWPKSSIIYNKQWSLSSLLQFVFLFVQKCTLARILDSELLKVFHKCFVILRKTFSTILRPTLWASWLFVTLSPLFAHNGNARQT